MGWQDRPYAHRDEDEQPRRPYYQGAQAGGVSVTTAIIIANIIVFGLMAYAGPRISNWIVNFGIMQGAAVLHGQIWRLLTATYMHAGLTHIFINMLFLYFLGPALERVWGRRQFLLVYTLAGVAGNILLTAAGLVGFIDPYLPGLGASGSVLALLGAAAVLFPEAEVYVYFLFPVRIRTCVIFYSLWYVYNVWQQGPNYGGDLCHLAGLAVGVWWAYSGGFSLSGRHRTKIDPSSAVRHLASVLGGPPTRSDQDARDPSSAGEQRHTDAEAIDRILAKVHEHGVDSLTLEEKRALAEASQRRQADQRPENTDDAT